MKRKKRLCLLLICIIFLLSSTVWAKDKDQQDFEAFSLGEIFVKGEKLPVAQETAIMTVITAEDIKATNSKTVFEALHYATGMRATSASSKSPDVSLHGFFNQSRILILIDGVPYYETYDGKLDLNQFTTDNVAKIEITKGAASVLYGANAMGGVINIVTKKAVSEKPFFQVNLEGGEVDYYKGSVSHGMKKGKFNYWLNYERRQQNGWRMADDYEIRQATVVTQQGKKKTYSQVVTENGGTRNQSDYQSDSVWAKFGLEPSEGSEYFVNFHYIQRERGINPTTSGSISVFPDPPAFSNFFRYKEYDDWGIDVSGQQKVTDRLNFKGKLYYHYHEDLLTSYDSQTYTNELATSTWKDYTVGGFLMGEYNPVSWNVIKASINFKGDSHEAKDDQYLPFDKYYSYTGSVGLEDEFRFSKSFSAVVGASYDWFNVTKAVQSEIDKDTPDSQDSFNPMAGVNYLFADSTKIFASAAKKTRFPTLSNLFSSSKRGGNPDLKAEKAINYTAGVSRSFSKYAWGEVAFFYHDVSDFIVRPSSTDVLQNVGKIKAYGVEVSNEFYPMESLVLRLGYTYNHASDESSNAVTDKVANAPEHTLSAGIQYTVPYIKTRMDLTGLATSDLYSNLPTAASPTTKVTRSSGYFVLNARLTQKIMKNFEAYFAATNLFDTDYEYSPGYPALGRNMFAGIDIKF